MDRQRTIQNMWETAMLTGRSSMLVSRAKGTGFVRHEPNDPVSFEQIVSLLGTHVFARVSVRPLQGRPVIVYTHGYAQSDPDSVERYKALPENRDATEYLRTLGLDDQLRGDVLILTGDAIYKRDQDATMRARDAATFPEISRDHAAFIKDRVEDQWAVVEAVYKDGVVPALSSSRPDTAKVAWMLRIVEVGLARDVDTLAAVIEARTKNPLLDNAMQTLSHVAQLYQSGAYEEFSTHKPLNPQRSTETPEPAGWSQRYKNVIH